MKDGTFFKQADLLVEVLPSVHAESCFALKGGTAINFFIRDFPRLSVDIDLVYNNGCSVGWPDFPDDVWKIADDDWELLDGVGRILVA